MPTLKNVFEKRQNASLELRALYDAAEGRELTAEEQETEKRVSDTITECQERELQLIEQYELEKRTAQAYERSGLVLPPTGVEKADEKPSFEKELRSLILGERGAVHIGYEQRDLVSNVAGDGPELIPSTLFNELHRLMVENSPIMALARRINTSGGEEISFPRVSSYSAASLVAEGATIGESDPQFNAVSMGAYKYGMAVQLSRELEQDAAFSVSGFVTEQGGAALGRGLDTAFMTADGSSKPQGIIPGGTLGVTCAATAAVTMDELISLQHSVLSPQRSRAVFVFNDATIAAVRKLKDTTGQYIWQPSNQAGVADRLLGSPVYSDPNAPVMATGARFGIFGDLSGFYVRIAGGVDVTRSVDYAFLNDLVTYRFLVRADSEIVDTTGIRIIRNATS